MAKRTYVSIQIEEDGNSMSVTRESVSEWPGRDATPVEDLVTQAVGELDDTIAAIRQREQRSEA